jgi:hypothetical protein
MTALLRKRTLYVLISKAPADDSDDDRLYGGLARRDRLATARLFANTRVDALCARVVKNGR